MIGEMGFEMHVIGQICRRHFLEQREHKFSARRGDKIIGVLYARRDALQILQVAERIIFQPFSELFWANFGVNRHINILI